MIAFIKLNGYEREYLLNVNSIIAIEDVDDAAGEYDNWVNTVVMVNDVNNSVSYMCKETVSEVENKLINLNSDKIRVI